MGGREGEAEERGEIEVGEVRWEVVQVKKEYGGRGHEEREEENEMRRRRCEKKRRKMSEY